MWYKYEYDGMNAYCSREVYISTQRAPKVRVQGSAPGVEVLAEWLKKKTRLSFLSQMHLISLPARYTLFSTYALSW